MSPLFEPIWPHAPASLTPGERPSLRAEFVKSARRGVNWAPEKIAAAAIEFCCGSLAANPHRVGKSRTHDLKGYDAARRGGYRVVHRINAAATGADGNTTLQ
jgi:mRNA-degrading endonuclease RelE of RelBE toxin-antitoxin system